MSKIEQKVFFEKADNVSQIKVTLCKFLEQGWVIRPESLQISGHPEYGQLYVMAILEKEKIV